MLTLPISLAFDRRLESLADIPSYQAQPPLALGQAVRHAGVVTSIAQEPRRYHYIEIRLIACWCAAPITIRLLVVTAIVPMSRSDHPTLSLNDVSNPDGPTLYDGLLFMRT
jgi:hypothetical protein